MSKGPTALATSPVAVAFPHIQWDPLGSLCLTAQETALLRMAETNPIEYTLADSRDASMYARVLLKLLAEAGQAGTNGDVAALIATPAQSEEHVLAILGRDPLGVVTHYALTKLYDIISALSTGASGVTVGAVFYVGKDGILVDQWKALLRILNKGEKGDAYSQTGAALCLGLILVAACPSQKEHTPLTDKDGNPIKVRPISYASAMEPLEALTAWTLSQLKLNTPHLCIPALHVLMSGTESRLLFCSSGGIKYIARQLKVKGGAVAKGGDSGKQNKIGPGSVQQLYELAFCLWTLTYELNSSHIILADFGKDGLAVGALTDLVSVAPREKVVRVALAALRNLATCTADVNLGPTGVNKFDGSVFLAEMLAAGLMKAIDYLKERQFTDPDIIDDVVVLHKLLAENYKEMSRWEVYKNEVESGHLLWGSCHTEAFFKENARMLEGSDGDFRLLKVLIALLNSKDDDIAAIACYDIGEFVRHYPNGRSIAKRLGAKELVMPLIEHENVELQRHALQCVSKIMVNNWEFVK